MLENVKADLRTGSQFLGEYRLLKHTDTQYPFCSLFNNYPCLRIYKHFHQINRKQIYELIIGLKDTVSYLSRFNESLRR